MKFNELLMGVFLFFIMYYTAMSFLGGEEMATNNSRANVCTVAGVRG